MTTSRRCPSTTIGAKRRQSGDIGSGHVRDLKIANGADRDSDIQVRLNKGSIASFA